MHKIYPLLVLIFAYVSLQAQDYRFGKVSLEEVQEKQYPEDSEVNAAVLYREQKIYYELTKSTGFTLVTEVHERIKIYNKDGFDWATREISYYKNGERSVYRYSITLPSVTAGIVSLVFKR